MNSPGSDSITCIPNDKMCGYNQSESQKSLWKNKDFLSVGKETYLPIFKITETITAICLNFCSQ